MNRRELPDGYREIRVIDLAKNRRELLLVNLGGLLIIAAMLFAGVLMHPCDIVQAFETIHPGMLLALTAMIAAYIPLHELTHGLVMHRLSGVRPGYGFSLMYAYAGSDVYFDRRSYVAVALAPVVLWGAVLLALRCAFPHLFWLFYIVQIVNISGAIGDFYCTWRVLQLPKTILIQDAGTRMQIFAPAGE